MPLAQLGAGYRPRLQRLLASFELSLPDEMAFFRRAETYLDRVAEWTDRIDLTSARDEDELVDLLFADAAAMAASGALRAGDDWLDIGSGVGAPGLALALLEPGLVMKLVEPRAKRVAFLRPLVASYAGLKIEVVRKRSEELPDACAAAAVSRATFPPPEWLKEGARLAREQVWVLLAREEPPALHGLHVTKDRRFEWPLTSRSRRAVAYAVAPPRQDGKIAPEGEIVMKKVDPPSRIES
jgi:16S rRNA (guanine527-N7)-methyltransferase